MSRILTRLLPAVMFAGALAPAMPARAFCILPEIHQYSRGSIPGIASIPVYARDDIWLFGVGGANNNDSQEIDALKAAIDNINSAATGAPKLFFAGVISMATPLGPVPPVVEDTGGIVVSTFGECVTENVDAAGMYASTTGNTAPIANIRIRRGNGFACENHVWYVDPNLDGGDLNDNDEKQDLIGTMTHELLHALGLGHTNDLNDSDNCAPLASNPYVPTASVNSVMWAGDTYSRLWRRRLKRDDIEGLRHLYGQNNRRVFFSESTSTTAPTAASWSAPAEIQSGLFVHTPVSLSDATRIIDEVQLAGFSNTDDEVRFLTGTWSGWGGNPTGGTAILEGLFPTPVHTWERVVVARGVPASETMLTKSREFVAWLAGPTAAVNVDEDINDLDGRIRFRVRKEGTWLAPQFLGTVTKYRHLGASYDPKRDVFVLAYIDVCDVDPNTESCLATPDVPSNEMVFVRTIDASTGQGVCTQALSTVGRVLAVGDVSCDFQSQSQDTTCKIPISTTDSSGPKLRLIEGSIGSTPAAGCFVRSPTPDPPLTLPLRSLGAPSSAMNGAAANGSILVAYTPQFAGAPGVDGYARIFTMDRNAQGLLDGGVDNDRTFQTLLWPLHVGTLNRTTGAEVRWRVITY